MRPQDVRIEAYRPGYRPGGMLVGLPTGIKATHLPTGEIATCTSSRHMHRNRDKALSELREQVRLARTDRRLLSAMHNCARAQSLPRMLELYRAISYAHRSLMRRLIRERNTYW